MFFNSRRYITKTLHYLILQKKHKFLIHLFNMKTEKSTEVFQKGKHIPTKIFIAKRWIKDEVLRDKDYTHKTRAGVLINQWQINGGWAPLKNVVSTSKRGDNSLFCLIQKKKSSHIHVMQQCSTANRQAFVNCRWIMLTKIFIES